MLILSRHKDEKLMIGDDITITVIEIRGDKVRLGIDAPSHIPVHRQEVYDAIRRGGERGEAGMIVEPQGDRIVLVPESDDSDDSEWQDKFIENDYDEDYEDWGREP